MSKKAVLGVVILIATAVFIYKTSDFSAKPYCFIWNQPQCMIERMTNQLGNISGNNGDMSKALGEVNKMLGSMQNMEAAQPNPEMQRGINNCISRYSKDPAKLSDCIMRVMR